MLRPRLNQIEKKKKKILRENFKGWGVIFITQHAFHQLTVKLLL